MDITIHCVMDKGVSRDATDHKKQFKNQLGSKPAQMTQTIVIKDLKDRIDIRWKKRLNFIVSRNSQFKRVVGVHVILHTDIITNPERRVTKFSFRNPEAFSNRVANYILGELYRQSGKLEFDNVPSVETIVGRKKNRKKL